MPDYTRRTANRRPSIADDLHYIINRYAMRGPTNGIMLCDPNPATGPDGHNGKVCYRYPRTAEYAADAINVLPWSEKVAPYRCPHGDHYHLVSARARRFTARQIIGRMAAAARRAS
jgi:hypothetical protein